MGRKTSTYARKRKHNDPNIITYKFGAHGVIRAKPKVSGPGVVAARCMPYRDNPLFDGDAHMLRVHAALDNFLTHNVATGDFDSFNLLSVSFNEGKVRALEIGGEGNQAFVVIERGIQALNRAAERFQRTGKWGLDGPARQELIDAVSLYEEIFWASSPQQMHDAAMTAFRWIEIQDADKHKQAA